MEQVNWKKFVSLETRKKKVNICKIKQKQKLNGVSKFIKINSCLTKKKKCQFKCIEQFTEIIDKLYLIIFGNLVVSLDNVTFYYNVL